MSDNEDKVEETKERIILEMENNEQYKVYFAQYDGASIKPFIKLYARHKAHLEVHGNIKHKIEQRLLEDWQEVSWKCLEEIQHKKLFDLSCQWYVGEVKNIPGIENSRDFPIIGNRILNHSHISSISEDELSFYLQYLDEEKNVLGYNDMFQDYQEYTLIKEHFDSHMNTGIPYYDYHNKFSGNDRFLSLKAIKKEKEDAYFKAALKERRKKRTKTPPPVKSMANIGTEYEELIRFAKEFNDLKTANFIGSMSEYIANQQDCSQEWAINYLNKIGAEQIPISANENWIDALYETAIGHRQEKVREILPAVYEEYLMKKMSGIIFDPEKIHYENKILEKWHKTAILDGRELCGEPRNFDY